MKIQTILFFLLSNILLSQANYKEIIPPENIKTIQLFNTRTQTHNPIIGFNDILLVSFDDIASTYQKYYYTIKHYDKDWLTSDLMDSQFIEGYFYEQINKYSPSFNTLQNYIHYSFKFPSPDLKPKISGNYALIIYSKNKNEPIFTRRFSISENIATISLLQSIYNAGSQNLPNQIIRTTCKLPNASQYQSQNIFLHLYQNSDWSTIIKANPQFIQSNGFEFNQIDNVFYGGNEYDFFDTKNITIAGLTTQKLIKNELYEAYLYVKQPYPLDFEYNPDVNGEFFIRRNDLGTERDSSTEGDYLWVNFALQKENANDDIYVVGSFNNYQCTDDNKLIYNETLQLYEKSIFLKQGYYNYKFIIKNNKSLNKDELNGNFWQTENQYQGLLYYRDFITNFDRLLGYGEINSLN